MKQNHDTDGAFSSPGWLITGDEEGPAFFMLDGKPPSKCEIFCAEPLFESAWKAAEATLRLLGSEIGVEIVGVNMASGALRGVLKKDDATKCRTVRKAAKVFPKSRRWA